MFTIGCYLLAVHKLTEPERFLHFINGIKVNNKNMAGEYNVLRKWRRRAVRVALVGYDVKVTTFGRQS